MHATPAVRSKAITSDVQLPARLVSHAEHNRGLFDGAPTWEAAFCEFVADSISLVEALEAAVVDAAPPSFRVTRPSSRRAAWRSVVVNNSFPGLAALRRGGVGARRDGT